MFNRFATLAAVCMLVPVGTASLASADPDPNAAPPPDNGIVASNPPTVVTTKDGWVLTVLAKNESQLPVAPLTTAVSSREYVAGATFTGSVGGSGRTKLTGGTLEVGYQIGCGIAMDKIKLDGAIGFNLTGGTLAGIIPTGFQVPIQGAVEVEPRPGEVTNVIVDKKTFKGEAPRITVKDIHIKIDNCVGESFLRSYAVLTSSTDNTDDIVAYYGVTKDV
jgi:hypothetical protein